MPDSSPQPESHALRSALDLAIVELAPLLPRISTVIKDREDDFLTLGSRAFTINSAISRFSKAASTLASTVGGNALQEASASMVAQSDQAKALFTSIATEGHVLEMTKALGLIENLSRTMREFSRLVRTLNVLGITTRIESARLGSAGHGFITLADDVESLAAKIVQHAEKINEHSKALVSQVSTAREHASSQSAAQKQAVDAIFTRLFANIADLEAMRARSASLVSELALGSRKVSENMSRVIASVQFHDITRQQVEHVEEILEQAVREAETLPAGEAPPGLVAWVYDVLRLQAPQLGQARTMFDQAVSDLIANLNSIADHIAALGARINAVAYDGQASGESILFTIRQDISHVLKAMRLAGAQAAETGQIMAQVAETIAQVNAFVADIEEVGSEIELIALNASVKAAHTGEQGRALGVLAVAIQHLSVDARAHTEGVTQTLTSISSTAEQLADLAHAADIAQTITTVQERFDALLDQLDALDTELNSGIGGLSAQGANLVDQLHEMTSSIHFHEDVTRHLHDLEKQVLNLAHLFAPFADQLQEARQPEKLREQLARYTMDSERLVHLAVLGHDGHDAQAVNGADDVELFGADDDGVELFDAPATDDDGVELFDDGVELFGSTDTSAHADPGSDDNVELFDDGVELFDSPAPPEKAVESEDDFGDNVELF